MRLHCNKKIKTFSLSFERHLEFFFGISKFQNFDASLFISRYPSLSLMMLCNIDNRLTPQKLCKIITLMICTCVSVCKVRIICTLHQKRYSANGCQLVNSGHQHFRISIIAKYICGEVSNYTIYAHVNNSHSLQELECNVCI